MTRPTQLDVLFALLGTPTDGPVSGEVLTRRLGRAGLNASPSSLLATLLGLERSGHLTVRRSPVHEFALTPRGEAAALDLGPGQPVEAMVVMVDLVGFVAFTEQHGDEAARQAATAFHDTVDRELRQRDGRLVKTLGDGVLATLRSHSDPVPAVRAIAEACRLPNGARWPVRGAAHDGRPVAHGGDLYGADVNLAARLCDVAEPGELVLSATGTPGAEHVELRGVATPVAIRRVALT